MNRKRMLAKGLTGMGLVALLTAPALAIEEQTPPGEPGRPERHDWRQLDERLRAIETKTAEDPIAELRRRVRIDGLLEVEGFHRKGYAGDADDPIREKESDIVLATAALDFHAELNDWVRGHLLLLWEENDTEPVEVDEAVISLGNPDRSPFFLNAGKMYVPFGVFGSFMIQDPLTLELGETNDTAVQVGFASRGFYGSVYAFNGDVDKAGRDNTIDNFGASAGYAAELNGWGIDIGAGYLNNLADSELVSDALKDADGNNISINDYISGMAAHLHLTYGPYTFYSEYVAALDSFVDGELDFQGVGAKPKAWHLEIAYTGNLLNKETTFALGYQGTDEARALDLPEKRYLAGLTVALTDNLSWSLEYAHDKDYGVAEGGTGDDANMITTQLALSF
jgi:hypothetical protein